MDNVYCFFNKTIVSDFFIKQENQISQSLEKRVLLVAMGIFAILSMIFLAKYYWRNGVASQQELGEKNDQKISDTPIATPRVIPSEPVDSAVKPVNSKKILANICRQLDLAPEIFPNAMMSVPGVKDRLREVYHQEIERFNNFLSERLKALVEIDVAYVCIGHGAVAEQIWPGFIFETLQSGNQRFLINVQNVYVFIVLVNFTYLQRLLICWSNELPIEKAKCIFIFYSHLGCWMNFLR